MKPSFEFICILIAVKAIAGCSITRFNLDKDFTCGTNDYQMYNASTDFPTEFNGASSLTLGIWFKHEFNITTNPIQNWIILYKFTVTNQNADRRPAVYFLAKNGTPFTVQHQFSITSTNNTKKTITTWQPQDNAWYFAIEYINLTQGTSTLTFIDSSQSISLYDQLSQFTTSSYNNSSYLLYFGNDNSTNVNRSCVGIWYPFMITGYTPASNNTLLSLAFGIVPSSIQTLLLRPYDVYENLFNYQNDSLIPDSQGDPGLLWSTNKQSYPGLVNSALSSSNLLSIKGGYSFLNVNQSLSFSMRLRYMIQNYSSDTCNTYWLVQRISTGGVTFGLGILPSGYVVVQIGSAQQTQIDTNFVSAFGNGWNNIIFGCYEQ